MLDFGWSRLSSVVGDYKTIGQYNIPKRPARDSRCTVWCVYVLQVQQLKSIENIHTVSYSEIFYIARVIQMLLQFSDQSNDG